MPFIVDKAPIEALPPIAVPDHLQLALSVQVIPNALIILCHFFHLARVNYCLVRVVQLAHGLASTKLAHWVSKFDYFSFPAVFI